MGQKYKWGVFESHRKGSHKNGFADNAVAMTNTRWNSHHTSTSLFMARPKKSFSRPGGRGGGRGGRGSGRGGRGGSYHNNQGNINTESNEDILEKRWLPSYLGTEEERRKLEQSCLDYLAHTLRHRMKVLSNSTSDDTCVDSQGPSSSDIGEIQATAVKQELKCIVKGAFRDLTCEKSGEVILENLFLGSPPLAVPKDDIHQQKIEANEETNIDREPSLISSDENIDEYLEQNEAVSEQVIRGSIIALRSLLILGTQLGVKGSEDFRRKSVSHLSSYDASQTTSSPVIDVTWDNDSIRKLKHQLDITAGIQLLAELKRRRNSVGAFDLLVQIGAWDHHEDLALLRSGFPIEFLDEELDAARAVEKAKDQNDKTNENYVQDIDDLLGIRKDLTHMKVYTIDSASTSEIDDGISVEKINEGTKMERLRYWIHIADADRWAPRSSLAFQSAALRTTSIYLPDRTIPMFPPSLCEGCMSLRDDRNSCALSLGVEINQDGSIDLSSLDITPSTINVNYRLTYDDVDEMLDMGVGYFEEWELGAMLEAAQKRREWRKTKGSSEAFVPIPIPQGNLSVKRDGDSKDGIRMELDIDVTHNAGMNLTTSADENAASHSDYAKPVSSAFVLVTEMMILAGEAMGYLPDVLHERCNNGSNKQGSVKEKNEDEAEIQPISKFNIPKLKLPYRSQKKADLGARYAEINTMESLGQRGGGYCQAWYARRFFEPVKITTEKLPHTGLGLDGYVQWTSPIRRFMDLQVHAAVKRYLRLKKILQLLRDNENMNEIMQVLKVEDLGYPMPIKENNEVIEVHGGLIVDEINYEWGAGLLKAARDVQRKSQQYWIQEYLNREKIDTGLDDEVTYKAVVLGCIDPNRNYYAIYIYNLGLETRYMSERGRLELGDILWIKVSNVVPRQGLLRFTLASKGSGRAALHSSHTTGKDTTAPAA